MNHPIPTTSMWTKTVFALAKIKLGALLCVLLGFSVGWVTHEQFASNLPLKSSNTPLRLDGYKFISPLLVCDTNYPTDSPELMDLKTQIEAYIQQKRQDGTLSAATVYFRDLHSGNEMNINGQETFYPASLKKLPLIMQIYKDAETNPSLLSQPITIEDRTDYNARVAIPPKKYPVFAQTYTIEQLLEYMIKYSDNISFQALYPVLGADNFDRIYAELQLDYPDSFSTRDDYATAYEFSLFFRTLYNATYLNLKNSEAVLNLLTQVDYTNGLSKYLPEHMFIAHKFGVGTLQTSNTEELGEVHDCGIIYHPNHPYILCIMTKSQSPDITTVEETIATISKLVYDQINSK